MGKAPGTETPHLHRRSFLLAGAATMLAPRAGVAQAAETIRIGRADQDLLADHHLRDGAAPEAVREGRHQGGADDLSQRRGRLRGDRGGRRRPASSTPPPASPAACKKGVNAKLRRQRRARLLRLVPGGEDRLADQEGRPSSPARRSASPRPAPAPTSWRAGRMADRKIDFTRVPLGGGGLVPNLLSGNIDATVLYSPLTYKVIDEKMARRLIDFGAEVPPHSTGAWIATDKFIKEKPQVVQKTLNALYGGARLPAGRRQPRRRRQADRRDRRDPRRHRRGRARRQHQQAVDDRRDEAGMDGARARHGAADRHDGPGAGGGYLHRRSSSRCRRGVSRSHLAQRLPMSGVREAR